MENSNLSRNGHAEYLGVNKMGKNIKRSPLHQPNFTNTKQQPQPQVYNISKNDFRSFVQRLTGSPSQDPLPRPPQNPTKHPSMRLQKIRPPPLKPINRHQLSPSATVPDEAPISAYMRYLQNSIIDSGPRPTQPPSSSGLFSTPPPLALPSPGTHAFPSPHGNLPGLFPSPTSQFLLQSPSSFLNLLSPRSPHPLISPCFQYPPPLTPKFAYSPMSQSGILGPGPQPATAPGILFPSSLSEFFPIPTPRWRDQ